MKSIGRPAAEISPFNFSKMAAGRHLSKIAAGHHPGFDQKPENSATGSADHENPTLEPNMKWIGLPIAE